MKVATWVSLGARMKICNRWLSPCLWFSFFAFAFTKIKTIINAQLSSTTIKSTISPCLGQPPLRQFFMIMWYRYKASRPRSVEKIKETITKSQCIALNFMRYNALAMVPFTCKIPPLFILMSWSSHCNLWKATPYCAFITPHINIFRMKCNEACHTKYITHSNPIGNVLD